MTDFVDLKCDSLARHLRKHTQAEVRFDSTTRKLYSTDASIYQIMPLGVVIPRIQEDLRTTVQVAAEVGLPIIARGGGTSLSAQSIGAGIIVDCSKYLNAILDIDTVNRSVRIQPGVVLDQLNRALLPHGLLFGPEVATASRANLGGMLGNNSAGSRSIVYGKTIDHVRRLSVLLADGSPADFSRLTLAEWHRRAGERSAEGALYRGMSEIVLANDAEIRQRFPRILRRVSGYNLDVVCRSLTEASPATVVPGLESVIVGSEGTLAVIAEAELGILPRPKARGLLIPHFSSLAAAMDALAACLEFGPSAVELMDQMMLDMARENLSLRNTMAPLQGRPAALFMVEFHGDTMAEVTDRLERLRRRLGEVLGITAIVSVDDPALREPLWNLRSAAQPLLLGIRGDRKPITFVEDAAVSPEKLPAFIARFRELLERHGTGGAFYGHASVGCIHIRPLLNLKDPDDVKRMRQITEAVTDLVLEFGGSLSGEHGDGLCRSEWNRKMFGDTVYEAFRQTKRLFDPRNTLNPGKIVDAPAMTENLRYGGEYHATEPPTLFDYSRQEGFVRSIEVCNGSGVCRRMKGGTMCPSFRATRDEKDSTRGRANILRLALSADDPLRDLRSREVHDVLDLCLMCKACKAECPSNVDMAKIKAEFLHLYYQGRPRPLGQTLMARLPQLNRLAAPVAPLANWVSGRRLTRWFLEKMAGIDRRRTLPRLHWRHFRRWLAKHTPAPTAGQHGRVILLDDCFTTYNEPEIGQSAVRVLEAAGYSVELAGLICCGRPMISKGFLDRTRTLIEEQLPRLNRMLTEGVPILGLEPSCVLTLSDEWPQLVNTAEARRVASAARLGDAWLAEQVKAGRCALPLNARAEKCAVHGHCHQKALVGMDGTVSALRLIPKLEVEALATGCCGMAGSFGFEREHYDLSVMIAKQDLLPALDARPDTLVVAPGTSCRHQIGDLSGRRALHPLEVLAEQLPPSSP
jgi:FAD/FMN-containing dehydrogenase/Fe-S oxidoreductase